MIPLTPARVVECILITLFAICLAFGFVIVYGMSQAKAHDHEHPEYDQWYSSLKQPDHPTSSCCGKADAYWADSFEADKDGNYVAIITDDRKVEGRMPIPVGTKFTIPKNKIKWDQGNPTGHGILFVTVGADEASGEPYTIIYCYLPPGGV